MFCFAYFPDLARVSRIRFNYIFNGFLAMKLQKLISLVGLLTLTTGRFRVPCFFSSKALWGPHTVDCFANHYN